MQQLVRVHLVGALKKFVCVITVDYCHCAKVISELSRRAIERLHHREVVAQEEWNVGCQRKLCFDDWNQVYLEVESSRGSNNGNDIISRKLKVLVENLGQRKAVERIGGVI